MQCDIDGKHIELIFNLDDVIDALARKYHVNKLEYVWSWTQVADNEPLPADGSLHICARQRIMEIK